jgi:hypothetical protein
VVQVLRNQVRLQALWVDWMQLNATAVQPRHEAAAAAEPAGAVEGHLEQQHGGRHVAVAAALLPGALLLVGRGVPRRSGTS